LSNVEAHKTGEMTGTDAEACAYLYTVSLTQPMDSDWTQIYLYIANQVYTRHQSKESDVQMPDDIRVESLSEYEMGELRRLKRWLYERRVKARQEKERGERRHQREAQAR